MEKRRPKGSHLRRLSFRTRIFVSLPSRPPVARLITAATIGGLASPGGLKFVEYVARRKRKPHHRGVKPLEVDLRGRSRLGTVCIGGLSIMVLRKIVTLCIVISLNLVLNPQSDQ